MPKIKGEYDENKKINALINHNPSFYQKFKNEWEQITESLRKINEANKLLTDKSKEKDYEVIRPTSSGVIFR